jgi:hypothetical protein
MFIRHVFFTSAPLEVALNFPAFLLPRVPIRASFNGTGHFAKNFFNRAYTCSQGSNLSRVNCEGAINTLKHTLGRDVLLPPVLDATPVVAGKN